MSGSTAAIMPMPMNEAEPRTIITAAVAKFAPDRSSPKNSVSTTSITVVCTRP